MNECSTGSSTEELRLPEQPGAVGGGPARARGGMS